MCITHELSGSSRNDAVIEMNAALSAPDRTKLFILLNAIPGMLHANFKTVTENTERWKATTNEGTIFDTEKTIRTFSKSPNVNIIFQ